jgi:hypothetical protein
VLDTVLYLVYSMDMKEATTRESEMQEQHTPQVIEAAKHFEQVSEDYMMGEATEDQKKEAYAKLVEVRGYQIGGSLAARPPKS